jgi:Fe-S-cluster containining protein
MEECLKCGKCCVSLGMWYGADVANDDLIKWHLYHGANIIFAPDRHLYGVEYERRCDNLTDDNLCAIYDDRPNICRRDNDIPLDVRGCVQGNIERFSNIESFKEVW